MSTRHSGGSRDVDVLTASTLKHLRERWWSAEFTDFLRETLQPRAGDRILDVGCGAGTAEVRLGQLGISQMRLFGVDLIGARVAEAVASARAHNIRVRLASANACALPFRPNAFDSAFCVAVLQHIRDRAAAVRELARVTKPGGRVLVIEPDNAARYWYSFSAAGTRAFELAARFFTALEAHGQDSELAVGPQISAIFPRLGIETTAIRLFPVSVTRLGAPAPSLWEARRAVVDGALGRVKDDSTRTVGAEYLAALDAYRAEATAAGPQFVEIQSTMLFATVGQKTA
ncbi:MAG TPA: methyltransferase domain-containing protein [Vicinamibacterales bacterium]|nr:methyltransferase domain-containing protein [Vicinamibacterales bacterium]